MAVMGIKHWNTAHFYITHCKSFGHGVITTDEPQAMCKYSTTMSSTIINVSCILNSQPKAPVYLVGAYIHSSFQKVCPRHSPTSVPPCTHLRNVCLYDFAIHIIKSIRHEHEEAVHVIHIPRSVDIGYRRGWLLPCMAITATKQPNT